MRINSREKGKRGELEVVRPLKKYGWQEARRTAQHCGNNPEGAADVVGLPGIHIEVKRVEHLNIDDAMEQSRRDAAETGNDTRRFSPAGRKAMESHYGCQRLACPLRAL